MNIKNINLLDISSTTAKKLLEIPYKPKVSRHNDNVLLTFVLNRDNNCPVDVFIHQEKIPNHPEVKKYIFYTNQDFVGERVFYIDTNHNVIGP